MKLIFWIITSFLIIFQIDFCKAQQQLITSYQNKEHTNINISLNGKVKVMKQFSYIPDMLCDTIAYSLKNTYTEKIKSGEIIKIQCISDTLIYFFDSNSFPVKIKDIHCYIDVSNYKLCDETIYRFMNGNLISETNIKNAEKSYYITYKYDAIKNLILKRETFNGLSIEDSLKYDCYNNLIKKVTYRFEIGRKPVIIDTELYQYDTVGNFIALTKGSKRKEIFIYDVNGNKIEEGWCKNFKGKKCEYEPSEGFVYDKNNRLIKRFSIGNWMPNNTDTYYQYDEQGRKTEVKGYNITKDTVLGYHYVYEYNENGQQTMEEEKAGNNRNIDFIGYKKQITLFDNYKNIIQQGYYDAINQPVKIIRYVYSYDTYGNWTKREKYEGKNEQDLSNVKIEERMIEYY